MVERDAFDRVMVQHLPAARRLALRLTGSADAADDVVQSAMLRAARSWRSFRGESEFATWLFRIVINAFRDELRRRPKRLLAGPIERSADPRHRIAGAELERLVAQCISTLPPSQREVLVLVAYENVSPTQAADVLGMSAQSARVHLHEARARLKSVLADYL